MANTFTKTAATRFGGPSGKTFIKVTGTLVIDTTATGGAAAGDLPATLFETDLLTGPAAITLSTNAKVYVGVPAYDQLSLLVTDGASQAPIDLPNGTYNVCLEGQ